MAAIVSRIRFARPAGWNWSSSGFLHGALLLPRRKWLVQFTVNKEVAQNATGTPGDSIGPAFDAGCVLLIDEDAATAHEMTPFSVVRAARYVMQDTGQACLEEDQGVLSGCDIPGECGLQHGGGPVHHDVEC